MILAIVILAISTPQAHVIWAPAAGCCCAPGTSAKRDAIDYACQRFGGGAGAQHAPRKLQA